MTQIIEIPLITGQDEGVDRTLLDPGTGLRLLQNCRVARDGRIEARPVYSALDMGSFGDSDTFFAHDVSTFEGALVAFGATDDVGYPQQVFRYTGLAGSNRAWKGLFDTGGSGDSYPFFPWVADLEILWTAPVGNRMTSSDIAVIGSTIAACSTDPGTTTTKAWVLRDDGTVLTAASVSACVSSRIVACGAVFVLLSRLTDGDIVARQFDTASAVAFTGATTLVSNLATGTFTWDATPVSGSTTDFVICYPEPTGTDIEVERWNGLTLTNVWQQTINVTPGNMACIAIDSGINRVCLAYVDASSDLQLYTRNSTTGAAVAGPTNILGPGIGTANCVGTPALLFTTTANVITEVSANTGTTVRSLYAERVIDTHVAVRTGDTDDVFISSKLYAQPRGGSLSQMAQGLGTCTVFGNALGTDMLFATTIQSVRDGFLLGARWNYGYADRMNDSRVTNYHGRSSIGQEVSGRFVACCGVLDEDGLLGTAGGTLQIVKFKSGATDISGYRRPWHQAAEMQGALYISGGYVGGYDGVGMFEAGGFLDTPVIFAAAQGTTGSLTPLATYNYVAVYEWNDAKGRRHRSAPSKPFEVVLTGANDDVTLTVSTAHSIRRADPRGMGAVVHTVIYRTTPDDSVFYRVGKGSATAGTTTYANVTTVLDTMSDVAAQERAVLYTQSQQPIENVGFLPCRFIAAGRDRLIMGGLPDPYVVAFSKLPFPAEPMNGADIEFDFAFQARLPEKVTAVSGFGDSYVAFTGEGIYEIPGEGPQRNGTGEFFLPRALYSDGGCIDARSVVDTAGGLFFQMAADKIYRIMPTGEIDFVGKRVRDTLSRYPVVRAAALCTETQRVAFLVVNSDIAATDGGILIYDLVHDAWSFDNIGGADGLTEYDGRIAYCAAGTVYTEASAVGSGGSALPTMDVQTGAIRLFSAMGQGTVCKIGLVGTYVGDSTIEGFISYNDGQDWVSVGTQAVTAANYFDAGGAAIASGDPFCVIFHPARREVDRFALRFTCTNASANTGGVRMHMLSLEVEGQVGTSRQPARYQR